MTISSLSYDVLPDDYQNEDVGRIFNILESGESLTLLAVGSAGKSNLLQFIMENRIKEKYLGAKSAPYYIMLMINAHNLVTLEGEALQQAGKRWTGYELMLFRLYNELAHVYKHKAFEEDEQKKTAIFRTYEQVEQFYGYLFGPQPLLIQTHVRNLERAILEVFSMGDEWRIVYLFDELDEWVQVLPIEFFQSLRGLRDAYKRRLMYVATSRSPLADLVQTMPAPDLPSTSKIRPQSRTHSVMEGFTELFSANTWYLEPLDESSAFASIERYFERSKHQLAHISPQNRKRIKARLFKTTGGHAGLLKTSFRPAIEAMAISSNSEFEAELIQDLGVQEACQAILESLTQNEIIALRHLAQTGEIQEGTASRSLTAKHVIHVEDGQYCISFPLLRTYLAVHS